MYFIKYILKKNRHIKVLNPKHTYSNFFHNKINQSHCNQPNIFTIKAYYIIILCLFALSNNKFNFVSIKQIHILFVYF